MVTVSGREISSVVFQDKNFAGIHLQEVPTYFENFGRVLVIILKNIDPILELLVKQEERFYCCHKLQ